MEIRVLTREDADAFRELRGQALERHPDSFGESVAEHAAVPVEVVAERLGSTVNFVVGAFADDKLVGTVGYYRDWGEKRRHKGHVWGVYVAPEFRAQRLGRRLLADLIARARSQPGLEQLVLSVASENEAAKRLYLSLGFEIFGHEPHSMKIGDAYIDEVHMTLRLIR